MEDEEAAPSIEKADLTHGATYSEHEVLLFTRGNDEDDDESRISKYASAWNVWILITNHLKSWKIIHDWVSNCSFKRKT